MLAVVVWFSLSLSFYPFLSGVFLYVRLSLSWGVDLDFCLVHRRRDNPYVFLDGWEEE